MSARLRPSFAANASKACKKRFVVRNSKRWLGRSAGSFEEGVPVGAPTSEAAFCWLWWRVFSMGAAHDERALRGYGRPARVKAQAHRHLSVLGTVAINRTWASPLQGISRPTSNSGLVAPLWRSSRVTAPASSGGVKKLAVHHWLRFTTSPADPVTTGSQLPRKLPAGVAPPLAGDPPPFRIVVKCHPLGHRVGDGMTSGGTTHQPALASGWLFG